MAITTYLFDLDGTLLDSVVDLAEAINRMLSDHGYPLQPLSVFPKYVGDGVRALVERALPPEAVARGEVDTCVIDYQKHYANTWNLESKPYDGIITVLEKLAEQGHTLGVLSNKPQEFTALCCEHFFPTISFQVVRGALPGVPKKPHPTAALEILKQLNVTPESCVYIGDSGVDMEMAVRAGLLPVGVRWGLRSEEELIANGARHLISTPAELLSLPL